MPVNAIFTGSAYAATLAKSHQDDRSANRRDERLEVLNKRSFLSDTFKSKKSKYRQLEPSPSVTSSEMEHEEPPTGLSSSRFYDGIERTPSEIKEDERFQRYQERHGYGAFDTQYKVRARLRSKMREVKDALQMIESILATVEEANLYNTWESEIDPFIYGQVKLPPSSPEDKEVNEIYKFRATIDRASRLNDERESKMAQGEDTDGLDTQIGSLRWKAAERLKALREYQKRESWLVEHYTKALRSGECVEILVSTW